METRTVEQVENWQTRSFTDGFASLRELSDGEFSGAVRAGGAWLFMLNGRIIGVHEGSLDDFEDADGTAYAAPHPSLPLLFSMQERDGQTQAKYYTNDTPLSEVDSTLSEGSFTGYVELSENVLSGDYYVAYYGGRSMSVAFVGASEQVLTGDEAFERADDEVGIYEVRDVDLEIVEIPEPEDSDESPPDDASGARSGADGPGTDTPETDAPDADAGGSTPDATPRDATPSDTGASPDGPRSDDRPPSGAATDGRSARGRSEAGQSASDRGGGSTPATGGEQSVSADATTERPDATGASADPAAEREQSPPHETGQSRQDEATRSSTADERRTSDAGTTGPAAGTGSAAEPTAGPGSESSADPTRREASDGAASADAGSDEAETEDVFEEEDEWRETTTIPSLDPDRSESPDSGSTDRESGASGATPDRASAGSKRDTTAAASRPTSGGSAGAGASSGSGGSGASHDGPEAPGGRPDAPAAESRASGGADDESGTRVRELRTRLEQREGQVEQLKKRLSKIESERNEYKRERDALRQEVERLEAKLESVESAGSGGGGRQLGREQAFTGTNLFVRYESKGEATLEDAAAGEAGPEDVNSNLRLEHHTQFEADDVTVDGDPFDEFLTDSFEYQFVSWLVERLLYEIRDTGHRNGLADLYEAIPRIDRVDLHGSVDVGSEDEETRQESFDVVMRDKMGDPLVVADLNGSRDPTTGEMMGSLVEASTSVAQTHDALAGAFQVTESFFEPAALETAESATSGGFLSREKRESFVKLSRKRGYHLCLVESRSGDFHLNVPEL